MNIKHIEIRGFGSVLEAGFDFSNRGVHLITGANGVGKTTLFNALFWGLYGETTKGVVRSDLPTLKKYRPKGFKGTYVDIELDIKGNPYRLIRTHKSKYSFEYSVGASDIALIDLRGEKNILTDTTLAGNQETLNRLIGLDSTTFQNSVFFGQGVDRLMESKEADKRGIFEDILRGVIGDISKIKDKVGETRTKKGDQVIFLDNKISKLQGSLEVHIDRVRLLGEEQKNAEQTLNNKLATIRTKIEGIKNQESECVQKLSSVNNRREKLKEHKKELEARLHTISEKYDIQELEDKFIDTKSKRASKETELSYITLDLKQPELEIGGQCDKCGSDITEQTLAKIQAENKHREKQYKLKLREVKKSLVKLDEELVKFEGLAKIKSVKSEYEQKLRDVNQSLQQCNSYEERYKSIIDNAAKDIERWQEREKELYRQKGKAEDEIRELNLTIKETQGKISDLKEEVDKVREAIKYLDWWSRVGLGSSGVNTYLYEGLLAVFNEALQKYSYILGMVVRLRIDKEKKSRPFLLECYDEGVLKSYQSLSGGEKQRVNIGILFALYEVICSRSVDTNILLLDEVFEGLDETGMGMVFEVLQHHKNKSVYIVTHQDVSADQVDFIEVTKDEKGTHYDQ